MIPYSYNMVDMGGIDLAEANGTVVPGIYERITEAMNLCGDVILYNWKFAEINIAPSAYSILQQANSILINGLIQVTELDQIIVIGLPPPPVPVSPLEVIENGVYEAAPPISGFNPVRVIVPERQPVIESISITENGVYTAPEGIDGYSPIAVDVPATGWVADEYSQPLRNVFDTEVNFDSSYTLEVAFYASSYVNDGHIVGQSYSSAGSAFHLTTYANKWFIGGTTEANFPADADCPLYGADIVYKAKTGEVSMNGAVKTTTFTMPAPANQTYKLNTRGGSISTVGVYKYKYVKVYDLNDALISHWEFGHAVVSGINFYLARDSIRNIIKSY